MSVSPLPSLVPELSFSQLIFGTWRIRDKPISLGGVQHVIDMCLEAGVTSFDLADIYGNYQVEEFFGRALTAEIRPKLQLITKCGICLPSSARPSHRVKHYNTSAAHIRASVEQSLRLLKSDWLDLLLIHRPDPLMNVSEVADIFASLKDEGKVRAFGVSNFSVEQMRSLQAVCTMPLVTNQIELNPLQTKALWDGTLNYLQAQKASAMIWSPLAGGRVFQGQDPAAMRLAQCLQGLSEKYGTEADCLLLSWLLALPGHVHPVLGTTDLGRLARQLRANEVTLERQDWFALLEAAAGTEVP